MNFLEKYECHFTSNACFLVFPHAHICNQRCIPACLCVAVVPECGGQRRGLPRLCQDPGLCQLRPGLQVPPGLPQRGGAAAGAVVSICLLPIHKTQAHLHTVYTHIYKSIQKLKSRMGWELNAQMQSPHFLLWESCLCYFCNEDTNLVFGEGPKTCWEDEWDCGN